MARIQVKKGLRTADRNLMKITIPTEISTGFIYACMGFGKNKPDADSLELIKTASEQVLALADPHAVYREFPLGITEELEELYILNEKNKLEGKAIAEHLAGCNQCILMAVTMGMQTDKLIRRTQITDMARAVALDACASSLIEDLCDQINLQLTQEYEKQNKALTSRFSPGYGDLPLTAQNIFSKLLEMEKKIGLTQNSEHLLIPRKSVTAVIGIKPVKNHNKSKTMTIEENREACKVCKIKDTCTFRQHGGFCGKK
ncbi:hypothetical protein [Aminipila terrae]|uniref:Methionine synthase n=1 Tax=Aminipila terrae TaxID=2697030 RepID=A0A6P1MCZ7_9FIRM|nr:hypothetical protein [Aminipila terrae]QHI71777.1 hypothetical protein Ami3637_04690 [Aminipila terrae]